MALVSNKMYNKNFQEEFVMNKRFFIFVKVTFFLMFFMNISFAHHAMEYIEIESYSTAKKGEFVFHWHYDYMVDNKNDPQGDHYEITPGLSYGIMDKLMVDIHGHFAKFGNSHLDNDDSVKLAKYQTEYPDGPSPFIEAGAIALQYCVTDAGQLPVNIAISPFFEFPTNRAKELLNSQMVFGGSVIIGKNYGLHNNLTVNLSYERDGDEDVYGWGIGSKFVLSTVDEHAPAFGIEILGDYEGHIGILPGIYAGILQNTVLKAGIFIGLSQYMKKDDTGFQEEKEEDLRANVTVMTAW